MSQSQTWDIIDSTEASDARPAKAADAQSVEDVAKHAETCTVLYDTGLRQMLIDDLEELECFLKQRQAELTSKD